MANGPKSGFRWISRDMRRIESEIWDSWFRRAATVRRQFVEFEDDPLSYNETASVSLLCSAASRAGLLGLAEYSVTKLGKKDKRLHVSGRADLWVFDPATNRSWGLEFKQIFPRANGGISVIKTAFDRARQDANCINAQEADFRVAALMVAVGFFGEPKRSAIERIENLAAEADFSCCFTGGEGDAYLMLDIL